MSFICPQELVDLAHFLADTAQPIARRYFRGEEMGVETKQDHSPVTIADRAIEKKWREIIQEKRPQDGIWGEEFGRTNEDAELTWIFDPIDGTKAFTLGRATFGLLIGLHHKQHGFILGIVDQPIVNLRWFGAKGRGAFLNEKPLQTTTPELSDVRISLTNPLRLTPDLVAFHKELTGKIAFTAYGGDCMNYVGLADGSLHLNFDSIQHIYDIAASIPIIEEAGGKITHKDGTPIDLSFEHTILGACTSELHEDFLSRFKKITA
jgi:histidinol phosphatase-like enzyme (inositol monophosphatase family)